MGFDAFEIAESISNNGYFAAEPIIVIPAEDSDKYLVVEGNRRFTAILGLAYPEIRAQFFESGKWDALAAKSRINKDTKIPSVIAEDRRAVVPVVGYRHIRGPLSWKPYPQARYIANLIDNFGMTAGEVADSIGGTKSAISDLYREQAIAGQARNLGIETGNVESAFSLLTVAMRNTKLREHIGAPLSSHLKPGTDPIPPEKQEELKELLRYVFGDGKIEPVIRESREIASLGNVMANPVGLEALRSGKTLAEAKQAIGNVGMEPRDRLMNRLVAARNALVAVESDLVGFENDPEVVDLVDQIAGSAVAIQGQLAI